MLKQRFDDRQTEERSRRLRILGTVFLLALAIRWAYAFALYAFMGQASLLGNDSHGYLVNGERLAAALSAGSAQGWELLGADPTMMPLFTWLVAINVLIAGALAPLCYVLMQGVIDAFCCLLIYGMAEAFALRIALPAAIAAAVNPTQIVLSGYLYTDTPFLFFVALFLLASLRWLRAPSWSWALLIGLGLGGATLCRVLVASWAPVLLSFLALAAILRNGIRMPLVAQLAAAATLFLIILAPLVMRNATQYGAWALTSQSGAHLALWVAPLVKEAQDGTPWAATAHTYQDEVERRFGAPSKNPFEMSRRFSEVGWEKLINAGLFALAKTWATGAFINLAAPALILSPPVMGLPRTGFYDTPGQSTAEKTVNFLSRSTTSAYTWSALLGVAGVTALRLLQLAGTFAALRERQWAPLLLLGLWLGFVMAVNGPVVSPKYRLPMEPALAVLTGAGFCAIRTWLLQRAQRTTPAS